MALSHACMQQMGSSPNSHCGDRQGEDHVDGDGEAPTHVPVGDLNVLNLCGIAGVAFCTAWSRERASWGQDTAHVRSG